MNPAARENLRYQSADFCPIRLEENIIFDLLRPLKPDSPTKPKLLDLGCGSGGVSRLIQEMGFAVNGLDFSEVAVSKAKQNGLAAKVANLEEALPEPDHYYDFVIAGDILEHLFDPISLLKESSRVLKPSGYLLLTIPNDTSVMVRLKTLLGISHQETMYRRSGIYKHHTFFTLPLLKFMLNQAGFKLIKQQRITNVGHRWQFHGASTPLLFTNEFVVLAQSVSL